MFVKRIIKGLERAGIKYALAGGYAVSLYGAVRGTVDVDVLVNLSEENLVKVDNLMASLGLVSKIPVSAEEIIKFRKEYVEEKNVKVWSFINPSLPIEIVDFLILYDLKDFNIKRMRTAFGSVNVVSLEDLIRMKKEAGRPQDIFDIEALEKLLES